MEIIFLGTSAMHPTKDRNLFSILFKHNKENILIDCGEGTQRQLKIADFSPTKINRILITHLHGDHINGLPGLFQNLYANEYKKTLEIYGPKGTKTLIKNVLKLVLGKIKIKVNEIKSGTIIKTEDLIIKAIPLNHTIKSYGYSIEETPKRKININYTKKFGLTKHPLLKQLQKGKNIIYNNKKILASKATYILKGKKITFIIDTAYCSNAIKLAKRSDILICESTFAEDKKEKANVYKHLTARQAATIAKKTKSKKLILTHFSQRYKTTELLQKEAKKIFKNTICAKDFMKIKI